MSQTERHAKLLEALEHEGMQAVYDFIEVGTFGDSEVIDTDLENCQGRIVVDIEGGEFTFTQNAGAVCTDRAVCHVDRIDFTESTIYIDVDLMVAF